MRTWFDAESLLRELAPQVLGVMVRRYRDFAAAEDAVQEALVAAAAQWAEGVPENPRAWLIQVASRDWPQILALYDLLKRMTHNPIVLLNHAVAVVHGPKSGLELLRALDEDTRVVGNHRLHAVRAHLLELAGNQGAASEQYRAAACRTTSLPERDYLLAQSGRLVDAANAALQNADPPEEGSQTSGDRRRPGGVLQDLRPAYFSPAEEQ